ncbi:hypothetical protein ACIQOW_07100 [Kitasatospora sp. NPDC091335]|uniref:hypothetical protein n=1 Tax=Kitasatospora sp. NPDC091335 TaxID=3364085 RepID=UPI00380F1615
MTAQERLQGPSPLPETRSYDELKDDPRASDDEKDAAKADALLGGIATLLAQRGDLDTARLVLAAEAALIEWDDEDRSLDLWLEIAPADRADFAEEAVTRLRSACIEVSNRKGYGVSWLGVRETLPPIRPGWRDSLREQVEGKKPTNQARRLAPAAPLWAEDNLSFTNAGEQRVYRALRYIQEKLLPAQETIGIFPLPNGRMPGRTWEPDVIVTYKGRAGVLEIDGPHHNARRALDTSRDHLLLDSGVGYVDRVPVESLSDPKELMAVLQRFLRRLADVR